MQHGLKKGTKFTEFRKRKLKKKTRGVGKNHRQFRGKFGTEFGRRGRLQGRSRCYWRRVRWSEKERWVERSRSENDDHSFSSSTAISTETTKKMINRTPPFLSCALIPKSLLKWIWNEIHVNMDLCICVCISSSVLLLFYDCLRFRLRLRKDKEDIHSVHTPIMDCP